MHRPDWGFALLVSGLVQRSDHSLQDSYGDCDNGGAVTVDELVKGVNIALDNADITTCPQFDLDGSGTVTVDEIVKAVNVALNGCGLG